MASSATASSLSMAPLRSESTTTSRTEIMVADNENVDVNGGGNVVVVSSNGNAPYAEQALATVNKDLPWYQLRGVRKAQAYAFNATGNGSVIISGVFLSASLTYLAYEEAGCFDPDTGAFIRGCSNRVYGMSPDTLVSNIYTIAALLAAFSLPVIGAIIDYSPHRRPVGICAATLMVLIQTVQIGTNSKTWFPMAVLQAVIGAIYELHYSLTAAYLPDIARYEADSASMIVFNRTFYGLQFGGEALFLIIIIPISITMELSNVRTAQISQMLAAACAFLCYFNSWWRFPETPRRHTLPHGKGHNILFEGFRQNWRTMKAIYRQSSSLFWFYVAVIIAEGGTSSLMPVALNILVSVLRLKASDVGFAFLVALIGTLPGIRINSYMSKRVFPKRSLELSLWLMAVVTVIAVFFFTNPDNTRFVAYLFPFLWGATLGWFYSAEQLLFSYVMPAGQESELTGFFIYSTIIMTWVPPMMYTVIVEKGSEPKWGLMPLVGFNVLAVIALKFMPDWDHVLEAAKVPLVLEFDETEIPKRTEDISGSNFDEDGVPDSEVATAAKGVGDGPHTKVESPNDGDSLEESV